MKISTFITYCFLICGCIGGTYDEEIYYESFGFADKDEYFDYYIDHDDSTITVKDPEDEFGSTELGKALIHLGFNSWADVTFEDNLRVIFENNFNFAFFIMSLFHPIPAPAQFITPSVNLEYFFSKESNPYSIFSYLSSTETDADGNQIIEHPYGGEYESVTFIAPKEAESLLYQRIEDAIDSVQSFGMLDSQQKDLLRETFDSFYEGVFQNQSFVFEETEPFYNIELLMKYSGEYTPASLSSSQMLYAISDDVVHLFFNEDKTSAYIVDVSSPVATNGISALVSDTSSLNRVYIYITHYHMDHVQSLAGFINMTDVPMTFVVPQTHLLPFSGWYLEAYPHVIDKIRNGLLEIQVVQDEWIEVNGFDLKTLLTHEFDDNRMLHFGTNAVPCFKDHQGRYRVFSGDFLRVPLAFTTNEDFIEGLSSWLREVAEKMEAEDGATIDLYFDTGHFGTWVSVFDFQLGDPKLMTKEELLQAMHDALPNHNLNPIMIHIKDDEGFDLAIHESYSPIIKNPAVLS